MIARIKTAAQSPPDLSQVVDDPLLKVAVICRDNDFILQVSDFGGVARRDITFVKSMLAVISK